MDRAKKDEKKGDRRRYFNEKWNTDYFFVESGSKFMCLICNETVSAAKEYTFSRHYKKHKKEYDRFEGESRREKFKELEATLSRQQLHMRKQTNVSAASVKASYVLSEMIAKASKPFSESEFVSECLVAAAGILCPEQQKHFQSISLGRNTCALRISELATNMTEKLQNGLEKLNWFSLAFDESTDCKDTAQLAVFVRGCSAELEVTEELLDLISMKDTATGLDVASELEKLMEKMGLPWSKLVGVATDGCPAMVGKNQGAVSRLCKKHKENSPNDSFWAFHCIIHQENLCAKAISMSNVMNVVVKCVNFIRSQKLNHRQFTEFLKEVEAEHEEILYYEEVRWLSRGRVLERF